jgi:hypothetical protein
MEAVEAQNDKNMIPRRQQGTALTLVILILAAFVIVSIPISPTLTVTVVINTAPNSQVPLAISTFSYDRVPLSVAIGTSRDVPFIVGGPTTAGTSTLSVNVTYAGNLISGPTSFYSLADGTYQIKVNYFPRTEQATTPYVVGLALSYYPYQSSPLTTVSLLSNIYP